MFRPRVVIDRDRSHKIDDDQTKHRPWRSGYRLPTSRAGYISLPFSLLGLGLGLGVLFSVEVGVWRSFWPILMACVCYWRHFRVLAFFKHCSHFKITHTRETNHSSIRLIASISSSRRRSRFVAQNAAIYYCKRSLYDFDRRQYRSFPIRPVI